MSEFIPYESSAFEGGARSYGAQGVCSVCKSGAAVWMKKFRLRKGYAYRAYCEKCKQRLELLR